MKVLGVLEGQVWGMTIVFYFSFSSLSLRVDAWWLFSSRHFLFALIGKFGLEAA